MRIQSLALLVCALAGVSASAQGFRAVSKTEAERAAISYGMPEQKIALYIWSDKYTYRVGESLTLRWTVKTNGDLYPYTIVAYRQNNQNGRKFYFPAGNEEVTDIGGRTLAQGFQPTQLAEAAKMVVAGSGGLIPAVSIPNEPGMHTVVVQLRDYTGSRVLKAAYMKIGVVTEQVEVSGDISANTTWVNTKQYLLRGVVKVKNNATLTIEPGTFVYGAPGSTPPSALLITQNGRLNAAGTKSRPIVMTSSQAFGERKRGDWGGLVMLGKAPINVGANANPAAGQNAAGTFFIEGLAADADGLYGGSDPNHSCGVMTYVRVEYAGSILSPNNELNSFTWGGCGKGTVAHHLQAIYGLDDSFEWFGGTMDAKYLVGGLGADDYLDFQLGWTGRVQFGIFYQSPNDRGNRGIEGDNSEYNNAAEPWSNPTIYNVTFIGSGQPGFDEADSPGIFLRRGARATVNNAVVVDFFSAGVSLADANTQAQATAGNVKMDGILLWDNNKGANGANTLAGQIVNAPTLQYAQSNANARNFVVANPQMLRIREYSDPNFHAMFGSPIFRAGWVSAPDDGFFDQDVTFTGGMGDEDWTEEWTSFLLEVDLV